MSWGELPPGVRIRFTRLLQAIHEHELAGHIPRELLIACHDDVGCVENIDLDTPATELFDVVATCPACTEGTLLLGLVEHGSVRCPKCHWWGHESEVRRADG